MTKLGVLFLVWAGMSVDAQTVVLQHAWVIDGTGAAEIPDATVVQDGRTIRSVGGAKTSVPPGARVVDLTGNTIMPGLISDHSHVGQLMNGKTGPGLYTQENILNQLAQFQAYGVTTVVSLGLNGDLFYDLRQALHSGTLPGADLFGADRGIGVPNGAPPVKVGPEQLYRPETAEAARKDVREMAARHPDLIKVWVDDFHGTLPVKMPPEIYEAVIDEADKNQLRVAAHIYYLADAKRLVKVGADILAHGVRDVPVDDEFVMMMKQRGVYYIATLGLDEASYLFAEHPEMLQAAFVEHALSPGLREHFADAAWRSTTLGDTKQTETSKKALMRNQQNLKKLYDAGVNIGFGTDSGANPERVPGFAEHRELYLTVQAGLQPMQAITLATRNAAALLQLMDRGTLAAGKRADFVVLETDPSSDISNTQKISAVWENGKQVSGPVTGYRPK